MWLPKWPNDPENLLIYWPMVPEKQQRRCGRAPHVIASVGCSFRGVCLLSRKPLSPKHRTTFMPLQHAVTLTISVDWGLVQIP